MSDTVGDQPMLLNVHKHDRLRSYVEQLSGWSASGLDNKGYIHVPITVTMRSKTCTRPRHS
jgi:hypothetical protein